MKRLAEWYPGDAVVFTCLAALAMIAILVTLAWAAEQLLARRHAALRSGLWLSALIGVLLTPTLALVGSRLPWHKWLDFPRRLGRLRSTVGRNALRLLKRRVSCAVRESPGAW